MEYVRITPLGHNYLAHIDFRDLKLTDEKIKEICYKINTFWVDDDDYKEIYWANDMGSFDEKYNVIELPKSYFINNNGGYDLDDIIEEIIDDREFGLYDQIISCIKDSIDIDDEIILQWDLEADFQNNWEDIEKFEDDIMEYIRDKYSSKYGDILWKLDKIYTELCCLISKESYTKTYCNTEGIFYMNALDDIEDDIFNGGLIEIHKDMSYFAKSYYDFCSRFDTYEMDIDGKTKERINQILDYVGEEKYDEIIQIME